MADLIPLYREMAERGFNFYGLSILRHRKVIGKLIKKTKSVTLLDFGCGRGDAYKPHHLLHERWKVEIPTLYDPAFAEHDVLPGDQFDGVLCSDVLEHVPEDQVDELIALLFRYATRFVWASVCCREAKKTFDDGTNLHVTIQPMEWWRGKFDAASGEMLYHLTETV